MAFFVPVANKQICIDRYDLHMKGPSKLSGYDNEAMMQIDILYGMCTSNR
jgi:hypothetical protein